MKKLINRVLSLAFAAIMLATPAVADSDWKSNLLDEFVSFMQSIGDAQGLKEDGQAALLRGGLNGTVGGACIGAGEWSSSAPLPEATVQKALRFYETLLRGDSIDINDARDVMNLCLTHIENTLLAQGFDKQEVRLYLEESIRQVIRQLRGKFK